MATKIIMAATPFFFLLIFIELWVSHKKKANLYRFNDAITSVSLGIISQTKTLVIFSFASLVYAWLAEQFMVIQWDKDSLFTWIFGFVLYDFFYYWFHRFSHQINFLWASHVVHHQSEEYNLTTALRQTSSSVGSWLFYIPIFMIGIPAEVFFISGALNLVYQFWVHTQLIGKMGWFENYFSTPSHHRVHHGQNQQYIDKNHGGVFIIWDKLFGTFQQELDDEKVIFGVRRPVNSFNPFWANIHTWYSLFKDAVQTNRWLDKFRIWFMPTGWRPRDVELEHPVVKTNPDYQVKFNPLSQLSSKVYVMFQTVCCLLLAIVFLVANFSIDLKAQLLVWILITLPLISCGLLLEARRISFYLELARLFLFTIAVYYYFESVYQIALNQLIINFTLGYTLLSLLLLSWSYFDNRLKGQKHRYAD